MRFLHAADLHLSVSEKDYSLGVLDEILGIAAREKCGALLLAGDVFDSCPDMESLRGEFRNRLETLPAECRVFFIPGNHEELRGGKKSVDALDFGRALTVTALPFQLDVLSPEAELLSLRFRRDYSDYRDWKVPPKKKPLRILLAHGIVPGVVYTGPEEDSPAGVIDPDLFAFFEIDLAALGHIHAGSVSRFGDAVAAYPGSARVWREGETGPRQVFLGSTEAIPPRLEAVTLASAGRFFPLTVAAGLDGRPRLPENSAKPGKADWVRLEISGVVEDEKPVLESMRKIAAELEKSCRRVTTDAGNLEVLAGISYHPLAREFLKRWETLAADADPDEAAALLLARWKGLSALKNVLESRR